MIGWRKLPLGSLGILYDGPHATPTRVTEGPYFLNIASLQNGRLNLDNSDHVSESEFATWTRRVTPQEGDLLFSYETRLGDAALMPGDIRACLGRRMALVRPDRSRVDPRYLLYLYLSPDFRSIIDRNTIHGATVNRISLTTMGSWEVWLPELVDQQAVAEVLGALDDKMSINARVVRASESLARSVLVFDSLLEGSSSVPLAKTARFANGKAFTKDATGSGRVVIRIAELNSGIGGATVYNQIDVADDHLARPGDLLFAWSGSLTVQRWFRPEAIVNQHIFKVIPNHHYPIWLVHQLLLRKLEEFRGIAADKATTMGHIQRRHLEEPVMIPSREGIERQHGIMDGLWHTALSAEQESLKLQELRDTLLPQLMSGKLRVRDTEKHVEEVV